MEIIKCACGKDFEGIKGKEDTCPDCLKLVIKGEGVKLGQCPYCGSINYSRYDNSLNEDEFKVLCECDDCEKHFTEYFDLCDIETSDSPEGDIICYSSRFSHDEKQALLCAMGLLIDMDGDCKNYSDIIAKLEGKLVKSSA